MKTFIIAVLFIVATVLPILFFPLLALTLLGALIIAPSAMKHGLWIHADEAHRHELELKH